MRIPVVAPIIRALGTGPASRAFGAKRGGIVFRVVGGLEERPVNGFAAVPPRGG